MSVDEREHLNPDSHEHCGHWTGQGSTWAEGGADMMICCECGAKGFRRWVMGSDQLAGHGPYYRQNVRRNEPVVWHDE